MQKHNLFNSNNFKCTGKNLWHAVEKDYAYFQKILEKCKNNANILNWKNPENNGSTPLIHASSLNQYQIVEFLISNKDVDVNLGDNNGATALLQAVCKGNIDTINILLKSDNIEINKAPTSGDYIGKTPLMIAKELVKNNKDNYAIIVNILTQFSSKTVVNNVPNEIGKLIINATTWNNTNEFNSLLSKLNNKTNALNYSDNNGRSALIIACTKNNTKFVSDLVNAGANVNAVDNIGCTGLFYAAFFGFPEVVNILLRVKGIDINKTPINNMGNHNFVDKTPLMIAQEMQTKTKDEKRKKFYEIIIDLLSKYKISNQQSLEQPPPEPLKQPPAKTPSNESSVNPFNTKYRTPFNTPFNNIKNNKYNSKGKLKNRKERTGEYIIKLNKNGKYSENGKEKWVKEIVNPNSTKKYTYENNNGTTKNAYINSSKLGSIQQWNLNEN